MSFSVFLFWKLTIFRCMRWSAWLNENDFNSMKRYECCINVNNEKWTREQVGETALGAPSACRRICHEQNWIHKPWDGHLNAVMYVNFARVRLFWTFNIAEQPTLTLQVVHNKVSHSQFCQFGSRKGRHDSNEFDPSGSISFIAKDNAQALRLSWVDSIHCSNAVNVH